MSMIQRVTDSVRDRVEATVNDIQLDIPDATRQQIQMALHNARCMKKLRVKVHGSYRAGRDSVWELGEWQPKKRSPPKPRLQPVASVFGLAERQELTGVWPPAFPTARRYQLMGAWDDQV